MENKPTFKPDPKLKLMEQVRQVLRYHHYAYRTEQTYCDWIVRFIKFHGSQTHPAQMGKEQIDAFLSHLATQGQVSASTQRQAECHVFTMLIFFYLSLFLLRWQKESIKGQPLKREFTSASSCFSFFKG